MRLFYAVILLFGSVLPVLAQSVTPCAGFLETNSRKVSQQGFRMAFALYTDATALVAPLNQAAPAQGQQWKSWANPGDVPDDDAALVSQPGYVA